MFMDPTYDAVFKRLFGSNDHKNLSMSLINALCEFTGRDRVTSVTFLNQETVPGNSLIRGGKTMVDVYCETEDQHKFIIEIQRKPENEIIERLMLYFSQMYLGQYDYQEGYEKLYPVIVIAINKAIPAFAHKKAYKSIHRLFDTKTHENDIRHIGFVLVELDKFKKNENELTTDEEKWLYLLKIIGDAYQIPVALQTGEFKEACDLLNLMTKNTMERMEYTNMILFAQSMDSTERAERAQAKAEGLAEGLAEGEFRAKLVLAKQMLTELSLEKVALITGISADELKKL